MSDPQDIAGVEKSRGAFWWLGGRAGRREFWVSVALLFVVGYALSHASRLIGDGLAVVMLFAQIRRVHDFGRSAWWAVGAMLVPLVPAIPLMIIGGQEDVALAVGYLLTIVQIVVVGVIPGSPGDNRFGPPPPFTARRVLTGR